MRVLVERRLTGAAILTALSYLTAPAVCPAQDEVFSDLSGDPSEFSVDGSYAYVRAVEGSATLVQAGTGDELPAAVNEPVLVGDRLLLSGAARAELLLPDHTVVRLADAAELAFLALARSPDTGDGATALGLRRGTLQALLAEASLEAGAAAVESPNAYVELEAAGSYLVIAESEARTIVVVRQGVARVRTEGRVTALREGEEVWVEGYAGERVHRLTARGPLAVERWGAGLMADLDVDELAEIDEPLRYAAAPLRSYGSWIYVRGRRAWRPHVSIGWRPYWYGRWRYTPSGLFWVSSEPWGWVPYHYGSWDHVPGYGWVWFPGRSFASAWVFWYWGPEFVGWIPAGYYGHRYGGGYGFRFGVYGWAGGLLRGFRDWCFSPVGYFGHRHQHRHLRTGHTLGHRRDRLGRGIITTDTRRLSPHFWRDPRAFIRALTEQATTRRREEGRSGSLPDVTPFIYRTRDLPAEVVRVTRVEPDRPDRKRADLTPRQEPRVVEARPIPRTGATEERMRDLKPDLTPRQVPRSVEVRPVAEPKAGAAERPTETRRDLKPDLTPRQVPRSVEVRPVAESKADAAAPPRVERPAAEDRTRAGLTRPGSATPERSPTVVEPRVRTKEAMSGSVRPDLGPRRDPRVGKDGAERRVETSVRKPSTASTRKPAVASTRKPSAAPTRKPSTVSTRKPSVASARKPSTASTRKPSTTLARRPSSSPRASISSARRTPPATSASKARSTRAGSSRTGVARGRKPNR